MPLPPATLYRGLSNEEGPQQGVQVGAGWRLPPAPSSWPVLLGAGGALAGPPTPAPAALPLEDKAGPQQDSVRLPKTRLGPQRPIPPSCWQLLIYANQMHKNPKSPVGLWGTGRVQLAARG